MDVITDPFWIILIKGAPTSLTTTWLCYAANMVQTCYWSRLALVIPGLTHQALMQICSQDSGLHWECCPKNKVIRKCLRVKNVLIKTHLLMGLLWIILSELRDRLQTVGSKCHCVNLKKKVISTDQINPICLGCKFWKQLYSYSF